MADGLERLKVLINSSTPIVVMETSEEMRAVDLVRTACSELNMATFEWTIADGLVRSGCKPSACRRHKPGNGTPARSVLSPSGEAERLTRAVTTPMLGRLRARPCTTPAIPCRRWPTWSR